MTPEKIDDLFRPFAQAELSSARKFGGTGLGLSISKKLAERLGGDIAVTSERGVGTTFELTVDTGPLRDVPLTERRTDWAPPKEVSPFPVGRRLRGRVLLAEDGEDIRGLILCILQSAGAEVTEAVDGEKALTEARNAWRQDHPYDLILTDMRMPTLTGFEMVAELRKEGYPGKIIALTAHAFREERQAILEVGCDGCFTKPFRRDDLLRFLQVHLPPGDEGAEIVESLPEDKSVEIRESLPDDEEVEPLVSELPHDDELSEFIERFLNSLLLTIERITRALEREELDLLSTEMHHLKGFAGTVGYPLISEYAERVERLMAGSMEGSREAIAELLHLCRRAIAGQSIARP